MTISSTSSTTGDSTPLFPNIDGALTRDRFALEGYPYIIRIFLGDVPEGPSFYFEDTPTQVGCVYNFSAPAEFRGDGPEGCANCHRQKQDHELSTGQVILTDYLVEHITKSIQDRGLTLQSLSREDVVEYLKKNLHWRISDVRPPRFISIFLFLSCLEMSDTDHF